LVAVNAGYWVAMLLTIPGGAFLMRLFMIQHDCGHGSYFRSRKANDWVGRVIGLLTLTPYGYWRRSHAEHHARNGHLDHRGMGDILTLTAREYRNLSSFRRLLYRLYRNPAVMFGLGPAFIFLVQFRLPVGLMKGGREPWISTMASNLVLAAIAGAMLWFGVLGLFLLVYIPMVLVAATGGVWMFYVQHQFEDTRWSCKESWNFHDAALHGSSHYDLPPFLRWLSANIGIHHIHHLASRIPFYRLAHVLRERPELRNVSRLTLRQSFATVRLKLWDEDAQRLITFREARAATA
jgi:omega-6 fatty acid desaturase (delta-12 desaturase)